LQLGSLGLSFLGSLCLFNGLRRFDLVHGGEELEPPLFVAERLWVHHDIDLVANHSFCQVSLQDVPIVLGCAVF